MSKYERAKGRSFKKGPSFIMLRHDMKKSLAWQSLSCPARAVWLEIMGRFNGYNNGSIPLSCREAADFCNIGKGTAARAFAELLDRGFIDIGEYSSFTLKYKRARTWILTHEAHENGKATDAWKNWQPPIPDSQKGRG